MSTLIVYYSHGGSTKAIADRIAAKTGAAAFGLVPAVPYPAEYKPLADEAWQEIQAGKVRAVEAMPDLQGVTRLFVGTPNWCGTMAPPVAAFLTDADLKGIEVVPFCTHGGGGAAKTEPKMQALAPDACWKPMLVTKGSELSEEDLDAWLATL